MNKPPPAQHAPRKEAVPATPDTPGFYEKSDPIPVPEVIDGDPEANWDLWQKAVALQDGKKPPASPGPDSFDTTQPLPLAALTAYTRAKPEG